MGLAWSKNLIFLNTQVKFITYCDSEIKISQKLTQGQILGLFLTQLLPSSAKLFINFES